MGELMILFVFFKNGIECIEAQNELEVFADSEMKNLLPKLNL